MAVPSFMMSFLAARSVTQASQFLTLYGGPWLVWEPGSWQPAASNLTTISGGARAPSAGDALCFRIGAPGLPAALKVGREPGCDIAINDATVSRHHVTLSAGPFGWNAESMRDVGAQIDGVLLRNGEHRLLRWGATLWLGNVRLSLYDDYGFGSRLRSM